MFLICLRSPLVDQLILDILKLPQRSHMIYGIIAYYHFHMSDSKFLIRSIMYNSNNDIDNCQALCPNCHDRKSRGLD